ncbi:unnamed protein product [Discula destructiva]
MATATDSRPKPIPTATTALPPEPAQAKDKEKVDYYGYLFEANKTPTKTLDALLRAIGQYIIDHLGDKKDKVLKPSKLAAFYRAVGGDYDKLFVHAPHESISYIWQVFGCRHTLEPTDSDADHPWNFEAPTVPAVTPRGFVRWESIQVLLTPEEHVPFILYAVRHWNLRHPETGEPFPTGITAAAFPSEPDPEISAWYESCGEKLRKEATPKASPRPNFPSAQDRVHAAFSHVRAPGRAGTPDYFSHHRSVPFAHVSPGHAARHPTRGSGLRVSPERMERTERSERVRYNGLTPQEERARRRSFSDYPSPHDSPNEPQSAHLHPLRPSATRRHSHPRRTDPDDSESDGDVSPRSGRRGSGPYSSGPPHRSPKAVPRWVHMGAPSNSPPGGTSPNVPAATPFVPNTRTEASAKLRSDDRVSPTVPGIRANRKSGVEGAKDWAKEKISIIFPGPSPSERIPSRKGPGSSTGAAVGSGGSRDTLGRSRSYDDGNTDSDSEYERERRRRRRLREREKRDREAAAATASYERERARRSREDMGPPSAEWDDGGGGGGGSGGGGGGRPRSRRDKERLDRERMAHSRYEYAAAADEIGGVRRRGTRGRGPLDDERDSPRDRTASPVIKGVGGRRYPAPPESPPL